MPSLQKKIIHGNEYWYIVECRRVNGKPRPFVIEYLGSVRNLLERLKSVERKRKVKSYSYGQVYCLYKIAEELNLIDIMRKHLPEQKRNGIDIAESILLGAIYRACKPSSKRAFSKWVEGTSLPYIMKFNAKKISSQHYWDQMDRVEEEHIRRIEDDVTRQVVRKYNLSLSILFYDTTNFFTFIATTNKRSKITARGYNKQKRNDLRQFNLALMTSQDFIIPLLSYIYQGNINDAAIFPRYLEMLQVRLKKVVGEARDITLVFDKGNNSKGAIERLRESNLNYVCSISIMHHAELAQIPLDKFYQVQMEDGTTIRVYKTTKQLWGHEHVVLIKISNKLKEGQIRGLNRDIQKAISQLQQLKCQVESKRYSRRKEQQIQRQVEKILKRQYIKDIIKVQIMISKKDKIKFNFSLDEKVRNEIIEKYFGKRVLVTNRTNWDERKIIAAYHGQSKIERIFKCLKNPYHCAVRPQFHWTDQKVKVHTYMCLLGLLLVGILNKKTADAGIKMSTEKLMDILGNIRQCIVMESTGKRGKPKIIRQLEEMNELETKLLKLLSS